MSNLSQPIDFADIPDDFTTSEANEAMQIAFVSCYAGEWTELIAIRDARDLLYRLHQVCESACDDTGEPYTPASKEAELRGMLQAQAVDVSERHLGQSWPEYLRIKS